MLHLEEKLFSVSGLFRSTLVGRKTERKSPLFSKVENLLIPVPFKGSVKIVQEREMAKVTNTEKKIQKQEEEQMAREIKTETQLWKQKTRNPRKAMSHLRGLSHTNSYLY